MGKFTPCAFQFVEISQNLPKFDNINPCEKIVVSKVLFYTENHKRPDPRK